MGSRRTPEVQNVKPRPTAGYGAEAPLRAPRDAVVGHWVSRSSSRGALRAVVGMIQAQMWTGQAIGEHKENQASSDRT